MNYKILFLPHCLEQSQKDFLKDYAEERDYNVHEVQGGSKVKNIINKHYFNSLDKIVGVACKDEIELMRTYSEKNNLDTSKMFQINLKKEGCENTYVNLKEAFQVLDS